MGLGLAPVCLWPRSLVVLIVMRVRPSGLRRPSFSLCAGPLPTLDPHL